MTSFVLTEPTAAPMVKATVSIQGMTCASCVRAIEGALQALPSVQPGSVSVNLLVGQATLLASPALCPEELITETIENAGYDASLCRYAEPLPTSTKTKRISSQDNAIGNDTKGSRYRASLTVSGMFCSSCTSKIESLLQSLQGAIPSSVKVSLATGDAQFEYRTKSVSNNSSLSLTTISSHSLADKIRDLGFEAHHIKIERLPDDNDDRTMASEIDQDPIGEGATNTTTTTRLDISGMTCASCVSAIESK